MISGRLPGRSCDLASLAASHGVASSASGSNSRGGGAPPAKGASASRQKRNVGVGGAWRQKPTYGDSRSNFSNVSWDLFVAAARPLPSAGGRASGSPLNCRFCSSSPSVCCGVGGACRQKPTKGKSRGKISPSMSGKVGRTLSWPTIFQKLVLKSMLLLCRGCASATGSPASAPRQSEPRVAHHRFWRLLSGWPPLGSNRRATRKRARRPHVVGRRAA
mmetsp:Transcript_122361/g.305412  ORF Transcript_122361/g.305412 Transcript_122361/m.305412 type:complete len:218 (-) Transcript_122361:7-660(-)